MILGGGGYNYFKIQIIESKGGKIMNFSMIAGVIVLAMLLIIGLIQLLTGKFPTAGTTAKYLDRFTKESVRKWVRVEGLMCIILAVVVGLADAMLFDINIGFQIGFMPLLIAIVVVIVIYVILRAVILKRK